MKVAADVPSFSATNKKTPYPFGYGAGYWWPTRPNKLNQ